MLFLGSLLLLAVATSGASVKSVTVTSSQAPARSTPLSRPPVYNPKSDEGKGPGAIDLKTAADFVLLAKSGISSVPSSSITGDIAASPIAADALTGFSLSYTPGAASSTSSQVLGRCYASDYADGTPAKLTQAVHDLEAAYTQAAGLSSPDHYNYGSAEIGGAELTPGLYNWNSGVNAADDVTLKGGAKDTFVFQVNGVLSVASGKKIMLKGGIVPSNVFWQVTGGATLNTNSSLEGIVSSQSTVILKTGASLVGRAYAQTAITLQMAQVSAPTDNHGNSEVPAAPGSLRRFRRVRIPSEGWAKRRS